MDLKDQLKQLADRIEKLRNNIQTEEATKNAFIMPFIQSLGYDVFNPLEIMPEYTCDIGTKKGEKIDYAVIKDGEPIILIECKHWKENLILHDNQLLRYFHVSKAKFGILTNGVVYKFYTDLETPNKMDEKPFLEINMLDLKSSQIEELKKFHKAYFDIENILSSASELKYTNELKSVMSAEFQNPSPEFVKLFAKKVYDSIITPKLLDQFTSLVKRSIQSTINEAISERLQTALKAENEIKETAEQELVTEVVVDNKTATTDEEIEGFFIVKSILRSKVSSEKITHRDAQSYFAILFDDNNRKPLCRLYLNSETSKHLAIIDEDKKEVKYKIETLDDIYKYSDKLIKVAERYL
jgi:Uncharacterized conserved protein